MLETGVQAKMLSAESIEGNSVSEVAISLNRWFRASNVVIHDLQICKDRAKWVALVIYRV